MKYTKMVFETHFNESLSVGYVIQAPYNQWEKSFSSWLHLYFQEWYE